MAKFGFYLMNKKGYSVLQKVLEKEGPGAVSFVSSTPNDDVKEDFYQSISDLCKENKIPLLTPKEATAIKTDYCFAVGWRWLIPDYKNLFVFHDSLLPRYRGFNPLVTALINKDAQVGVTALFAGPEFDVGNVLGQRSISIDHPMKISRAIDLVIPLYCELVLDIMGKIQKGQELKGHPQDESKVTYSLWRDEADYRINWNWDAEKIQRHILAVGLPYNGATAMLNNRLVRIYDAQVLPNVPVENRGEGKVLFVSQGYPVVVCGTGMIKITEMTYAEGDDSPLPLKSHRYRFS